MDEIIREIGERLHGMREILDISIDEMAAVTGTTRDEYLSIEGGKKDFSFTFLYKAANRFGLDLTELMTGESPHLTGYSLVRKGDGLPIELLRLPRATIGRAAAAGPSVLVGRDLKEELAVV